MSIASPSADPSDISSSLLALCAGVLPVWERHLATSRVQSEGAVTEMLQAFAEIGPHLDRAARQSQQITDALAQADGGMTGLVAACERELRPLTQDAHLPPASAAAIWRVIGLIRKSVDALEQVAKPFSHETKMVEVQVERMYVGFQYQDRVSQMMALLQGDITRLQQALTNPECSKDDVALDAWLVRLESQYAMEEQRKDHNQGGPAGDSDDSKEMTFF